MADQEFERHDGNWHEWSLDMTARNKDGLRMVGEPARRLFVRLDADCLISFTVIHTPVTSESPDAREVTTPQTKRLILGDEDAVWLRDALTKAIEAKRQYDESPDA